MTGTPSPTAPALLLVGGAGPAPLGIDVALAAIEQARARGLSVHLIGHAADLAETAEVCRIADSADAVNFEDPGAAVAWAKERAQAGRDFDIIFTVRELALPATARIAEALGRVGNDPEVIDRIRSKDRCRAHLAAAGFPQPAVRLCHSAADAHETLSSAPGHWVVKPRVGAGSEGVSLVRDQTDLDRALAALPPEAREDFLVEEFVDGREFSVEGLFRNGRPQVLAVTAKEKMPLPHFVESGHTLPAPLPETVRREIEETVVRAVDCVGLCFGLFHVELWLTDRGVVLGEIHARLGGDYIHRMLAYAVEGLEMFGEVYDDALRRPDPAGRKAAGGGASRYFTPPPGRLVAVEGWEEARAHPAVLAAELDVSPGDVIKPICDSDDRVGALAVGASTPEEARQLVAELVASVRFTVEDAGAWEENTS